jgi:glutathione reductase (NADPH)
MKEYDLIIIGSGPAGRRCIRPAIEKGMKFAIIENKLIGGVCPNTGCNPKKILVHTASIFHKLKRTKGIRYKAKIDWQELITFKRSLIESTPEIIKNNFLEDKVDYYEGTASFKDKHTITIRKEEIKGKKIIIATGSTPRKLDFSGHSYLTISDQFLNLEKLPKKIIFIGAGYISFELAHVAALAGSEVRIIHYSDNPLKQFDSDMIDQLIQASEENGIVFQFNEKTLKIEKKRKLLVLYTENKSFNADMIINGTGRIPDIENLNLKNADIDFTEKGITINKIMQTTQKHIFAIGDCAASGPNLTPVADFEAKTAIENCINEKKIKIRYPPVPSVVFTQPPVASVGLHENEIEKNKKKCRVLSGEMTDWFISKIQGLIHARYKIIIEDETEVILGAHMIGYQVEELIHFFTLAIHKRLTLTDLKTMLYAYPTSSYDIKHMI